MPDMNSVTNMYDASKPYVIVCEGIDDENFLRAYLRYLTKQGVINGKEYNIWKVNGIDNMKSEMKNYKKYDGYAYMKSFLFICDGDTNADAASSSLIDHISRNWNINLDSKGDLIEDESGVKVGFYIMPGLGESGTYRNGALEDLCLDVLDTGIEMETYDLIECIREYMDKLEQKRGKGWKRPHKNRLHLALSSTDAFAGDKLGQAAIKGAFDFSGEAMAELRSKIMEMQKN